jgi:GNAT superfamily N-acetyltransferase
MDADSVRIRRTTIDHDAAVTELLGLAVGVGRHRLQHVVQQYRDDPAAIILAAVTDSEVVGVAGYVVTDTAITLRHIATAPNVRRSGIGRRLLAAIRQAAPSRLPIEAETDVDAVGFYTANGFTATSLGEKYPGVERFRVRLSADM